MNQKKGTFEFSHMMMLMLGLLLLFVGIMLFTGWRDKMMEILGGIFS